MVILFHFTFTELWAALMILYNDTKLRYLKKIPANVSEQEL